MKNLMINLSLLVLNPYFKENIYKNKYINKFLFELIITRTLRKLEIEQFEYHLTSV